MLNPAVYCVGTFRAAAKLANALQVVLIATCLLVST